VFHPSDGDLRRPNHIAAGLRRLADDLAAMPDDELPTATVSVSIQFCSWSGTSDEERQAAVDAVSKQLLGILGEPRKMRNGTWQHTTPYDHRADRDDGIRIGVFTALNDKGGEA
jgi:hypothetical protein